MVTLLGVGACLVAWCVLVLLVDDTLNGGRR